MLPGASWRIFKFLGIPIEINFTWIIIFGIFAIALSNNFYPLLFPGETSGLYILLGVATTILFFGSLILHELSHSYIAVKNGIKIQKIILFLFGGVSEMKREVNEPVVELKMALVGPVISFSIAVLAALVAVSFTSLGIDRLFIVPLVFIAQLNVFLAIFNLLPGFPLDGGRMLRAAIWRLTGNLRQATVVAARSGEALAAIFLLGGLFVIIQGSFLNGIWIMLIGWFLGQAAISSYEHTKNLIALSDIPASKIMTADLIHIPADYTVDKAVSEYFVKYRYGRFPVDRQGQVVGLITIGDIDAVPREQWGLITVDSIAKPIGEEKKMRADQPAVEAMNMLEEGAPEVLIYDDDNLVGIITRNDVLKLVNIKRKLGIAE